MFEAAARDEETVSLVRGDLPHDRGALTAQELADAAQDIYMPVSADGGRLLYNLVRATKPATVVEFGTSYGISTLHLAAAVRDNGTGRVVTTEMSRTKAASARDTFAATGLDDVITVLEGDALQTLAALTQPVGFLFLDGWKDLCLPVLRLLEPHIAPGTLVVAKPVAPSDIAIGDHSRIDDFCVIAGKVDIGRYVHVTLTNASGSSATGWATDLCGNQATTCS
jgi:predicted O-methyltransferase YrrM